MLNLDTHILIYALTGDLSTRERNLLSAEPWSISSIVLWEMATLSQLGRVTIDLDGPDLSRLLAQLHVWPLDWDVCRQTMNLDFQSDPADEIIAATSIVHQVRLLTRDRVLRKSRMTPLA